MATSTDWRKMDMWYRFSGSNLQACYGWGTRDEADAYAAYLNRNRGVNMYGHEPLDADDAKATALAGCCDITAEGVNLSDALAEIREADAEGTIVRGSNDDRTRRH